MKARPIAAAALIAITSAVPAVWAQEDGTEWEGRTLLAQFKDAMQRVQELREAGDLEDAREQLRSANETLDKARQAFDNANAGESRDVDVLLDCAEAQSLTEDVDLAVETLRRAASLAPLNAKVRLALGANLVSMGESRYDEAARAYREALALNPPPPQRLEALRRLGMLHLRVGLYELAEEDFAAGLGIVEDDPLCRTGRAMLQVRRGELLDAANTLDALGAIPREAQLGEMLPRALDDFALSRRGLPEEAEQHAAYGKLLLRANRVVESILPLERAAALDPGNFVTWNLLASASRFVGSIDRAREAYEQSLKANPDQPKVRQALKELAGGETPEPPPEPTAESPTSAAPENAPESSPQNAG